MSDSSQAIEVGVSEKLVFDGMTKHLPLTEQSLTDMVITHAKTLDHQFIEADKSLTVVRSNAGTKGAEAGAKEALTAAQAVVDGHDERLRQAVEAHVKEVFANPDFLPLRNDLEGAQRNYATVSENFRTLGVDGADKARDAFQSVMDRNPQEQTMDKLREALSEREIGGTQAATAAEEMLAVHKRLQETHGAVVGHLNAHVDVKPFLTSEPVVAPVIPEVSVPENAAVDAAGGAAKKDAGFLEKLYKTEGKVSKLKVGGLAVAAAAAGYAIFGGKDEKPEKAQVQMAGASVQPMQAQAGMAR